MISESNNPIPALNPKSDLSEDNVSPRPNLPRVYSFSEIFQAELKRIGAVNLDQVPPRQWKTHRSPEPRESSQLPANETDAMGKLYSAVHAAEKPLTALCLSGGGIRSATFCLGVLQALGRARQLDRFHYLSTVSGGGYIGGWLSAWLQRDPNAINQLSQSPEPEPPEISGLRKQSNYLAPRRGWSADTWTLIALYIRNLVLNWLVLIPPILSLLIIPRITLTALLIENGNEPSMMAAAIGTALLALAIGLVAMSLPSANKWQVADPIIPKLIPWTLAFSGFFLTYAYCRWKTLDSEPYTWGSNALWNLLRQIFDMEAALAVTTSAVAHAIAIAFLAAYLLLAKDSNGQRMIVTQRKNGTNGIGGWTLLGLVVTAIAIAYVLWLGLSFVLPLVKNNPYALTVVSVPYILLSYSVVGAVWILFASPWTQEIDREWWATSGGNALALAILWVGLHSFVYYGPTAFFWLTGKWISALALMGGLAGIATTLGGYWGKRQLRTDGANGNHFLKAIADRSLQIGALLFVLLVFGIGGSLSIELLFAPNLDQTTIKPLTEEKIAVKRYDEARNKLEALVKALADDDRYKSSTEITAKTTAAQLLQDALSNTNTAKLTTQNDFTVHDKVAPLLRQVQEIVEIAVQTLAADLHKTNTQQGLKPDAAKLLREQAIEELRRAAKNEVASVSGWFGSFFGPINRHMVALKNAYEAHLSLLHPRFQLIPFLPEILPGWLRLAISLMAIALIVSLFVGVNRYSLHALYANRLTRAYLGASNKNKRADPLTAFDTTDDLNMCRLPGKKLSDNSVRLFPIVNVALNLANSDYLEWQQRKASSFTFSPFHTGSWLLGYQKTPAYTSHYHGGVTLGQAIGISGAAVSPNMGYNSSTLVTNVMTFFNARLGQWFPNPGICGAQVWHKSEPLLGVWPLSWEMLGNTTDQKKWVNLSDGGHFDNLGLYEMVRRRCKRILVIDASADPEYRYEDLSTAIRLIRADMGVTIEFPQTCGPSRQLPPMGEYSIGKIKYPESANEGLLVYVKPVLTGQEPLDTIRYFAEHSTGSDKFPHQSTADQFFNEAQFESYRILGYHQGTQLFREIVDFEQFDPHFLKSYYPKVALATQAFSLSTFAAGNSPMTPSQQVDNIPSSPTARDVLHDISHTNVLNRTAGAFQSWSTATMLGTALTVGGIVGVSGTVALGPGGQVTLTNTSLPLDIRAEDRQLLRGSSGQIELPDTLTQNAINLSVAMEKLTKAVASGDAKEVDLSSSVATLSERLIAFSKSIPPSRAAFDQNELKKLIADAVNNSVSGKVDTTIFKTEIKALNDSHTQLRESYHKTVMDALNELTGGLKKVENAVTGVGPRRNAIEGREAGR